jgi:hypothetical protein
MNEIYWITRLDSINTIATVAIILSITLSVIIYALYLGFNGQIIYDAARGYDTKVKEYTGYKNTCKNILKYTIPTVIVGSLMLVFIPTTKEALLIYGIGGTVDYIKQNPIAKQLPDKCVKALDKWVDSWNTEEKKDTIK